jgi:hypothetical protein
MILAAPLVIPFAKAVPALAGIMGGIGMAALSDRVNEYIQENPEESMKILSTIIPGAGIGQIFMSKEDKISLEDLEDMTDEEAQDLSKEDKAELMKQAGKTGGKNKRQTMIDISEKLGLSGPGREKQDIEYEVDERYDEGGVEDAPKPKFDYTKFFRRRRADGGAIGIEVLFEEKKPRKDFNLGGLTGPAKNIYDTMMAAGYFTEDEIRNAIINAGYEIPGATTTTPVINTTPNIIGRDGDDGPSNTVPKDPFAGLGFSSANFGLGVDKDVMDYEADAAKVGRTFKGQLAKAYMGLRSLPTPFNIASRALGNISDFVKEQAAKRAEAQAKAAAAAAAQMQYENRRDETGGYQSSFGQDTGFMEGSGTSKDMGSFKDGGLVSMFVEKK